MILLISNSQDATADYLESRLTNLSVIRLDSDTLSRTTTVSLSGTDLALHIGQLRLEPNDVHAVVLRRPRAISPIAPILDEHAAHIGEEWAEALEGFLALIPEERWVNHPRNNAMASHKPEQLLRAQTFGLQVPETIITQDSARAIQFWEEQGGRVAAKAISGGAVEYQDGRLGAIYTSHVTREAISRAELVAQCPTMFQAWIDKALDVRLTALDGAFVAVALRRRDGNGEQILDIRRDNMDGVSYDPIDVPDHVSASLAALLTSYKLRFAAVDFVVSRDGTWYFLEINPNGQWAWLDLVGAADIGGLFVSKLERK